MYKNKSQKPQLRIGLSRTVKPTPKSPIKISPAPGVRPRTQGLSRSYKAPKNIDNLVKSPILTNPIKDNTPKDVNIVTIKTRQSNISEDVEEVSDSNLKEKVFAPLVDSAKKTRRPKKAVKLEEVVPETPITRENEDTSISYSPLDIPEITLNKDIKQNQKVLKAKRLILGSAINTPQLSPKKKLSTISNNSNASSTKTRKFSRLSLKKSCTTDVSDDDEIKPFKKKFKSNNFGSDTSIGSNMSCCSVVLDRLDTIATYNHADQEEKVVEIIDLSQERRLQLIEDIVTQDQVLRAMKVDLEALKQSVIYKNKHDVEELSRETLIWRKGCELALNDLLMKVKEVVQSDLTMDGLLKQLNVPETIFKYNPETEELI